MFLLALLTSTAGEGSATIVHVCRIRLSELLFTYSSLPPLSRSVCRVHQQQQQRERPSSKQFITCAATNSQLVFACTVSAHSQLNLWSG
jgi:hypothetical protein